MPEAKKSVQSLKIDGNRENLPAELARSKIYQAVVDNLNSLGVRPGAGPNEWDWGLTFDLHFGLMPAENVEITAAER